MCNSTIFEVRHSIGTIILFFRRYVQISKKKYQKILEINQLALLHKPSCERLICCRYAGLRNLLGINPLSTKIFNINEEILTGLIYQKRFWHQQCSIFEQVREHQDLFDFRVAYNKHGIQADFCQAPPSPISRYIGWLSCFIFTKCSHTQGLNRICLLVGG